MGGYDLPALINYVTSHTNQDKMFYVGHSMGTTSFMVMANKHPEVLENIKHASLMAPVAYINHLISPLKYIQPYTEGFEVSFLSCSVPAIRMNAHILHLIVILRLFDDSKVMF